MPRHPKKTKEEKSAEEYFPVDKDYKETTEKEVEAIGKYEHSVETIEKEYSRPEREKIEVAGKKGTKKKKRKTKKKSRASAKSTRKSGNSRAKKQFKPKKINLKKKKQLRIQMKQPIAVISTIKQCMIF